MTDLQIIELYIEGQETAITETRQKYGGRLYRTAMNILGNREDAEECVSDALLKAWDVIPQVRPKLLGAFLAKITRNLSINKWKAKGAARRGGGEISLIFSELEDFLPTPAGPEEEYESSLIVKAIDTCLSGMEQQARIAFVLRYFHGESIRGVAERFNTSESKIKSMLFRARKKLCAHLEQEGVTI